MKKFAAFLMILSLSVFSIGCGGKTGEDAGNGGSDSEPANGGDAENGGDSETNGGDAENGGDSETNGGDSEETP